MIYSRRAPLVLLLLLFQFTVVFISFSNISMVRSSKHFIFLRLSSIVALLLLRITDSVLFH
ncbi:hypothetical protein BC829DRAFT_385634 [Chytridium lagenaria]|nr:hypothetical protein BC829DRAFT_385634 [Chytridium lagenaria]